MLPPVKCSKCSASIAMDDMGTHVCNARLPLKDIAEYSASAKEYDSNYHGPGRQAERPQRRRPPEIHTRDANVFNSTRYARNDLNSNGPDTAQPGVTDRPPMHNHVNQSSVSGASTVLGRLNTLKTGVLDSKSLTRPVHQARLGPVQTRDPRATMIPIGPEARNRAYELAPVPALSPLWNHPEMQPFPDDNCSVISGRSLASSGRGRPSTTERLRTPHEEVFPSSLSSGDSGPFHHVSSRLDPSIFVPQEETASARKTPKKPHGLKNRTRKDVYDDDWEEQGIEHESIIAEPSRSRPSTAESHKGPRIQGPGRTCDTRAHSSGRVMPSASTIQGHDAPQTWPSLPNQDPRGYRLQQNGTTKCGLREQSNVPIGRQQYTLAESGQGGSSRPGTSSSNDQYRAFGPESVPTMTKSRIMNTVADSLRGKESKTHVRHETSSSLGTVLTTSTMQSVRSSVSSPPTSPPTSDTHYSLERPSFDESLTPRPGYHQAAKDRVRPNAELTPKAIIPRAQRQAFGALKQPLQEVKRSDTTESFDRLLRDIGSSIDELEVPSAPFTAIDGSPSSNYSPIKPSQAVRPELSERLCNLPLRLGSPASLLSKETASSQGSDNHSRATSRAKNNAVCRGCATIITGKSVSSADGKLTGKYHKSCFKCAHEACYQSSFPNGEFYVFDDRPYCSVHYHATAGSACAFCGEGIEGECIATADNRRFHIHCHDSRRPVHTRYGAF